MTGNGYPPPCVSTYQHPDNQHSSNNHATVAVASSQHLSDPESPLWWVTSASSVLSRTVAFVQSSTGYDGSRNYRMYASTLLFFVWTSYQVAFGVYVLSLETENVQSGLSGTTRYIYTAYLIVGSVLVYANMPTSLIWLYTLAKQHKMLRALNRLTTDMFRISPQIVRKHINTMAIKYPDRDVVEWNGDVRNSVGMYGSDYVQLYRSLDNRPTSKTAVAASAAEALLEHPRIPYSPDLAQVHIATEAVLSSSSASAKCESRHSKGVSTPHHIQRDGWMQNLYSRSDAIDLQWCEQYEQSRRNPYRYFKLYFHIWVSAAVVVAIVAFIVSTFYEIRQQGLMPHSLPVFFRILSPTLAIYELLADVLSQLLMILFVLVCNILADALDNFRFLMHCGHFRDHKEFTGAYRRLHRTFQLCRAFWNGFLAFFASYAIVIILVSVSWLYTAQTSFTDNTWILIVVVFVILLILGATFATLILFSGLVNSRYNELVTTVVRLQMFSATKRHAVLQCMRANQCNIAVFGWTPNASSLVKVGASFAVSAITLLLRHTL
jgi:hypothetical protein